MTRMSRERRAYERSCRINGLLWVLFAFIIPAVFGKVLS